VMMMGTPSGKEVQAPKEMTKFLEDQEKASADEYMPPGLQNISNTCYMNSTIQCLGTSKELRAALQTYAGAGGGAGGGPTEVATSLSKLYSDCESEGTTQTPMQLWTALRGSFPQFDEQAPGGRGYAQQDADECWEALMSSVSQGVQDASGGGRGAAVVENLFYGEKEVTLQCEEDAEEAPTVKSEKFSKLPVHLNQQTTHVSIGLRNGIDAPVEKHSEKLGRNAVYKKSAKLSRLPYYLTVQFVRFEFVVHSQKRTKIIRACNFDEHLDVFELCSDKLKETLKVSGHRTWHGCLLGCLLDHGSDE
jgi:ubiquitin carboxyl-terminal hydrolase 14